MHYRWGDVAVYGPGAKCEGECRDYRSEMRPIVAAVRRAMRLLQPEAQEAAAARRVEVTLFSEGKADDPPFVEFRAAFPAATLRLESSGERYDANTALLHHAREMAAADVLVTSCGNLGSLLAVLHWRGVTLQHPCTAQHFPTTTKAARRFLAFDKDDGSFDDAAFLRLAAAARRDEPDFLRPRAVRAPRVVPPPPPPPPLLLPPPPSPPPPSPRRRRRRLCRRLAAASVATTAAATPPPPPPPPPPPSPTVEALEKERDENRLWTAWMRA